MIEHDVVALDAVSIAHDGSTTMEGWNWVESILPNGNTSLCVFYSVLLALKRAPKLHLQSSLAINNNYHLNAN